jgi:hypothetical protein
MYIRRSRDAAGAWYEPHTAAHPSDIVRTRLEAFFGPILDPGASVVHSTAWRYEYGGAGGRLILTYLAVLPPLWPVSSAYTAGQITLEPVGAERPARSGTLAPPDQLVVPQVLAHALDHLRLLLETDVAIANALGSQWRAALKQRQPRPAGELRLARASPDVLETIGACA